MIHAHPTHRFVSPLLCLAAGAAFLAACTHDFNQFEPLPDALDGGDAAAANDGARVDAPSGEAGDAACGGACVATAKSCAGTCTQKSSDCTAQCPNGNSGKACREQCQASETQCKQSCTATCEQCSTGLGCSNAVQCASATQ